MKKVLIFLLISISAFSQITVTGTGNTDIDGHIFTLYNSTSGISAWCMTPDFTYDSGTNIYRRAAASGPADFYYIIRRNGHWVIELNYSSGAAWKLLFRTPLPSTDIDPPCQNTWEIWSGLCFSYGNNIAYTGTITNSIVLSGTNCTFPSPVTASTIYPNQIHLPQLTSSDIGAIVNPVQGMITYDINLHCVNYYNGVEWKCIYNDIGPFNSDGNVSVSKNAKVIFGQDGLGEGEYISNLNTGNYNGSTGLNFFTNNTSRMSIDAQGGVAINYAVSSNLITSTFHVNGSKSVSRNTFSTDQTLDATMNTVFYTGPGGHTFTLPQANSCNGREYNIINHGSGAIFLSPNIRVGISSTTQNLATGIGIHIISDGNEWRKIN
ncbi:MAG: hypothetical protein NXI00_13700 [Cytophagales bacterium]|nr:hypothetical protein [Cytophagales bacterium]